jgi:hypothetical protein
MLSVIGGLEGDTPSFLQDAKTLGELFGLSKRLKVIYLHDDNILRPISQRAVHEEDSIMQVYMLTIASSCEEFAKCLVDNSDDEKSRRRIGLQLEQKLHRGAQSGELVDLLVFSFGTFG